MSKKLTNNVEKGRYSPEEIVRRRKERNKNRSQGMEKADWTSADPKLVLELIEVVARIGVISLGYTRDGGALYVSYYVGGETEKVYIRPTEDIDMSLTAEIASWTDV